MSTVIVEMKTLCKNKVLTDLVKTPLEYIFLFAIITSKYKNTEQYTTNKKKSERKKKYDINGNYLRHNIYVYTNFLQ